MNKNKQNLSTKDKKEVKSLFREARKKAEAPRDESNILEWSMAELNAYIKVQTKGMSMHKKMKFANALIKRIEAAKKK